MTDSLFDSAADALLFAFRFCGQQYARGPQIFTGKPIGNGKGLGGLDGAAQAGFITREVRALGALHHYALLARFAERFTQCTQCGSNARTAEWLGACRWLAEQYRKQLAPDAHVRLMDQLVQRYFSHHKRTLAEIGAQFGDHASKVKHINSRLVPALRSLEAAAQSEIESALIEIGIVGNH